MLRTSFTYDSRLPRLSTMAEQYRDSGATDGPARSPDRAEMQMLRNTLEAIEIVSASRSV